jgi:hypothetical protein
MKGECVVNVSVIENEGYVKVPRADIIAALIERDGTRCMHPDADHELDFDAKEGPAEVTIDHWYAQWYGKENGWTQAQIWDLSNLRLMCKRHNAKKGDLIPNEDGTLPVKPQSTFRFRRQKRANRGTYCDQCDNGHNLFMGEICASCGGNAQNFPRWAKERAPDCDHSLSWCWACSIGIIERPSSIGIAMRQADSTELGEILDDEE